MKTEKAAHASHLTRRAVMQAGAAIPATVAAFSIPALAAGHPDTVLLEAWRDLQTWTVEINADDADVTDEQTAREGKLIGLIRDTPAQTVAGLLVKLEHYWHWVRPDDRNWTEDQGVDGYPDCLIFDALNNARRMAGRVS